MSSPNPSTKTIQLVGLSKVDYGRSCTVHPDGCGVSLAVGDRVLLRVEEIDEVIPKATHLLGRKKQKLENMPRITGATTAEDLMKFSVVNLKSILKDYSLSQSGNKFCLVEKIVEHLKSQRQQQSEEGTDDLCCGVDAATDAAPISKLSDTEPTLIQEEFPELETGDPHPDSTKETTTCRTRACVAILLRNGIQTCRVGFVSKPYFNLYGNRLHNCVGFIKTLLARSEYKSDRERSYRGNGVALIVIEPLQR